MTDTAPNSHQEHLRHLALTAAVDLAKSDAPDGLRSVLENAEKFYGFLSTSGRPERAAV